MNILFLESELRLPLGALHLPLRSTVVKTPKGTILFSPLDFTRHQIKEIREFGEVTDIVAPSLRHHLYLSKAMLRFPRATVWGPPGCRKKVWKISWDKVLGKDKWPYQSFIEVALIRGVPKFNELAFYDKESRALIAGDLCFNVLHPKGWAAPILLRLMGLHKKLAVSPYFKFFLKDRERFATSMDKILKWDFDKIAMAHGQLVTAKGKQMLAKALKARRLPFNEKAALEVREPIRLAYAS